MSACAARGARGSTVIRIASTAAAGGAAFEVEQDECEQRARFIGRRGQRDAADVAAAAVEFERERNFAGRHPAQLEPLDHPLDHRAHHETHRLEAVHAPFEFDRLGEIFGRPARDQRRAALSARYPYQPDRAGAEPAADRANVQPRQLAQPPDSPSRERLFQFRAVGPPPPRRRQA